MMLLRYGFIILMFFSLSNNAKACSCDYMPMKDAVSLAQVVFSGKVITTTITKDLTYYGVTPTKDKKNFYELSMDNGLLAATIVINKTYKGTVSTDTVVVLTPIGDGACGINFQEDEQWVIFGTKQTDLSIGHTQSPNSKAVFFTNLCSGSSRYTNEAALLEEMQR